MLAIARDAALRSRRARTRARVHAQRPRCGEPTRSAEPQAVVPLLCGRRLRGDAAAALSSSPRSHLRPRSRSSPTMSAHGRRLREAGVAAGRRGARSRRCAVHEQRRRSPHRKRALGGGREARGRAGAAPRVGEALRRAQACAACQRTARARHRHVRAERVAPRVKSKLDQKPVSHAAQSPSHRGCEA